MDQNRKDEQAEPLAAPAAASPAIQGEAPVFLPVPVRPRHDGWTPERQRAFIEHLADTGSIRDAAALVGMTEQSATRLRRRSDAGAFAAAWDAAHRQGLRQVLSSAIERGVKGTIVRRYYHGELIAEERVYSERLMMFLLEKAERLLGRSAESDRTMRDWDGAMDRLEAGAADEGPCRVWQDEQGTWLTSFPPPDGFDGYEEGAPGGPDYVRTLTDEEEDAAKANRDRSSATILAARTRALGGGGGSGGRRGTDRQARSKTRR